MTYLLATLILVAALACAEPRGVVAVALSGIDSVALFDAQSLDLIATLPTGRNPHEIAASSDGTRAYVANAGDTSITVLEGAPAPRVVSTWYLPDSIRVHDVAASGDGRTVWGAAAERQLVLDIDAASGRVRRRLPVDRPGGWMIEAGGPGGRLVVAHLEGGAVTLLDPADGRQQIFLATEGEIDASPTPDAREIWSANLRSDSLTAFDARTGTVLERMLSGKGTGRIIFTRSGNKGLSVNGGDSTVVVFEVGSRRRLAVIAVAGDPKVIAIDRAGRRAYLTHPERNLLTVVDVQSMTVIRSVAVRGTPDGITVLEPARMPPPSPGTVPLTGVPSPRLNRLADSLVQATLYCGNPPGSHLAVGDSVRLRPYLEIMHGDVGECLDSVPGPAVWASSKPAVLDVSQSGWVVARRPGPASVVARLAGGSATRPFTVLPPISRLRWRLSDRRVAVGDTVRVRLEVLNAAGRVSAILAPTAREGHDGLVFGPLTWNDSAGFTGVAERSGLEWFRIAIGSLHDSTGVVVERPR